MSDAVEKIVEAIKEAGAYVTFGLRTVYGVLWGWLMESKRIFDPCIYNPNQRTTWATR